MTTVLPQVAQLQYLIAKNSYEDGEYEAYEMNRIMDEIEPIIEDGFGNGARASRVWGGRRVWWGRNRHFSSLI